MLIAMTADDASPTTDSDLAADAPATRKRARPGERREQILQALAAMLQRPGAERITTAALAAELGVSEAALYRHFASKAQMFEALIDFIESSVFGLVNQITARELGARAQAARVVEAVLRFGEANPGLARVMAGDALVLEHERLQQRMNQLFDKLETALHQCLREERAAATPDDDARVAASVLAAFAAGRLQRFARTGFRRRPTERLDACLHQILLKS